MSTVQDLSISLEYPDYHDRSASITQQKEFYSPGDYMEGVVTMTAKASLRVRGLYLNVMGQANTSWENPVKRKAYEDEEMYLDHSEALIDNGMNTITFPTGQHRFAFRYQLPDNLPSTFHGAYGNVMYQTRVILDTEDEMDRAATSQPFMVLRRDILPQQAYQPVEMSKSKVYFGLEVGKIKIVMNLNHAVAVPGEAFLVNAEVFNWSGKDITLLEGSMVQVATYHANNKKLIYRKYLSKRQDFFDVNLKWGRKWTDIKIQVPPHLSDSGLHACNIIDVKYIFQFRAQIKGQDDITLEAPLYVGYHQDDQMMARDPKAMLIDRMLMDDRMRQPARSYRPN